MNRWDTVAIVGVGLLGGSIGLALQKRQLARHVVGIGRRVESLGRARDRGTVTTTTTDLARGVAEAELIVVCTPVGDVVDRVCAAAEHCPPTALITDVGSTKSSIVRQLQQRLGKDVQFVGSHPMAGSEKTGPENAVAELFEGRVAVVTPADPPGSAAADRIEAFWQSLGARVLRMSPESHDRAVAMTSHATHVIAASLAAATTPEDLPLAAGGWCDTTRIAAGDAQLWQQILLSNRDQVLKSLGKFEKVLSQFRAALERGDEESIVQLLDAGKRLVTLWEVDIYPAPGQPDVAAASIAAQAADLGMPRDMAVGTARGYLLEGQLTRDDVQRLARELLADDVVERTVIGQVGDASLQAGPEGCHLVVHVLPKPGVMDPVAQSALNAIADFGMTVHGVRTLKKIWLSDLPAEALVALRTKVLANDSIEQVLEGPLALTHLDMGQPYAFELVHVPIRDLDDEALMQLSRKGQLYLTLVEMQTIQQYYRRLERDPTDVELETLAQTWSEHCSHKTLAGQIAYRDERGERHFQNMLKETIFAATQQLRKHLGSDDWCVSVFEDNAGVVRFDDHFDVVFKVETHNHPSALEPYGGANTGIGGVIRDPLGTGLGAKPICNTDVFCFAPPDMPFQQLPPGVLHPRRVMQGVVSGVRDYGNRMGIPTVNGAVYFDERYLGNPLVYCGTVGILPRDKSRKQPEAGDHIVAIGGRTGRDGIHGATFSSAELTSESETLSGGAVQIGNAITEKMLLDVVLVARDRGLYNAITDCGAGGFSSAVGEMGEKIGAEVWLDAAPLKYEGLSYTEIWISEAQERMILSVSPHHWDAFRSLCESEGVEATIIGTFVETGRLRLLYQGQQVADLDMRFLHDGRPPVVREAHYDPRPVEPLNLPEDLELHVDLLRILGSLNVASKEWIIRQYDHEVQGGSVVKPLVGVDNDGPGDAAVLRPVLGSQRGLVVACGMNPCYGDLDPYHMAASAIDEAVRNCVAVGADPSRIAILDNFCWGYTDRPETLGSLVRAALACHDVALALGTPFISGKDSLNNEFSYADADGQKQTIAIPSSLLVSALGQVDDVRQCVTMDLKEPGNFLYQVGTTYNELGGSHVARIHGLSGGQVPRVETENARTLFAALHQAIRESLVRSCHDLSEGGLAVTLAEMAFAGGLGAMVSVADCPQQLGNLSARDRHVALLFAESNTRFVCEVSPAHHAAFEAAMSAHAVPCSQIGIVQTTGRLQLMFAEQVGADQLEAEMLVDLPIGQLKEAWQAPLQWS